MIKFKDWVSYQDLLISENLEVKALPPKILWITGMLSKGDGPVYLNKLGYDCKGMSTLTNRSAAYIGRFERYAWAKWLLKKKAAQLGKAHLAANIEKHDKEIDDFEPDVIIGTSQGGAVAMQLADKYPHSKFVLGAPAWKIFHADPNKLPSDTIIIQGKKDITVPYEDNKELAETHGFEFITYDGGHAVPWDLIRNAVDKQLERMGITPPKQAVTPEV